MKDLIKILKLVNKTETWKYNLQWAIYDEVVKDISCVCEVIDQKPYRYNQFTKDSLLNKDNWVTFDDCVKMIFYIENNDIYVHIEHYTHGKAIDCWMGYYRYDKIFEWEATIKLPIEFIKNITDVLDHKFDKLCNTAYEEYLEGEKLKWIEQFKKDILSNNNI